MKIRTYKVNNSNKKVAEILSCNFKNDENVFLTTCPKGKAVKRYNSRGKPQCTP